ncbi:MAG: hypothetical protein F4Z21_11040, partial [Acidobacteria bacterium]|nr:hypothetical protein [Acidobacteriota bacterium]
MLLRRVAQSCGCGIDSDLVRRVGRPTGDFSHRRAATATRAHPSPAERKGRVGASIERTPALIPPLAGLPRLVGGRRSTNLPRMQRSEFEYPLPSDRIALYPSEMRDRSRLLRLIRASGRISHHRFAELPELLTPRDLLVLNNTKVFPARLVGNRAGLTSDRPPPGGVLKAPIEVLLVRSVGPDTWEALVKPGRRIRVGERLLFGGGQLKAVVAGRGERGLRVLRFEYEGDFDDLVDRLGHVPLPPYIHRPDEVHDRDRYQTVYARKRGAVAAPTAGLHFTPQVFADLSCRGVARCEVTLHVGLGTFRPVVS